LVSRKLSQALCIFVSASAILASPTAARAQSKPATGSASAGTKAATPSQPSPAPKTTPPRAPKPPAATPPPPAPAKAAGDTKATGTTKADPKAAASKPTSAKPTDAGAARVKKARDLWYRGVDAFRNGNYEEARLAFAECYQLMPKSDVLRNLSISELQSGHYVSAARHLTQLLAAPGDLPEKVREEATSRLAQAQAQIGQLAITVDIAGAEIRIDDQAIGNSPLEGNWYIEPGQHQVTVSKPGYPADERQVFALAGVSIPVTVGLEALRQEQANDAKAALLMGTHEGQTGGLPHDEGLSTGSTIALATTSGLAALGLVGGIAFTVAANGHQSNVDGMALRLASTTACAPGNNFKDDCAYVLSEAEQAHTARQRAIISFIGFGVASAATLGYALWLSLDDEGDEQVPSKPGAVTPSVSVSPGGASIGLQGSF